MIYNEFEDFNFTNKELNKIYEFSIEDADESVLNEVYFGDSTIKHLQEQFTKFRRKWVGKQWNPKINFDPDLIKFNRMVEDQFGYHRFCLNIDPSYDYNAYMFNIDFLTYKGFVDNAIANLKVYKSNKGFYFDKEAGVTAVAACLFGFIRDERITDREIVGILLHEIGHSFTMAVLYSKESSKPKANALVSICAALSNMVSNNMSKEKDLSDSKVDADVAKVPFIDRLKNLFSRKTPSERVADSRSPMNLKGVIHNLSASVRAGMNKNMKYYDYTNEKFADTFASMYGYSSDVQSALDKLEKTVYDFYAPKNAKTPGTISTMIQVGIITANNMLGFLLGAMDPHPEKLTRIQTQIDYLERELRNTSLDPKMKQEIQAQIDMQKKIINDYINYSADDDWRKAYRVYAAKMWKKYGGELREKVTDNDALFAKMDDVYQGKTTNAESAIDDIADKDLFKINPVSYFV